MPTLETLSARLDDSPTSEGRIKNIHLIAATKDPAAIPILAEYLDVEGPVAEAVIAGLLSFGPPVAFPLRQYLETDDSQKRRNAALVLARLGDAKACALLATTFFDYTVGPLATARWLVLECGKKGVTAILRHADYDATTFTQLAVEAMAARGEELADHLFQFADDPKDSTRFFVLNALALMPCKRALARFRRLYADRGAVPQERCLAVLALGKIEGAAVVPGLCETLADKTEEPYLRGDCALVLADIGDARALPFLEKAKRHRDWRIRTAADSALAKWPGSREGSDTGRRR